MPINLDVLKQRLQQMQQSSQGGQKSSDFLWKPPVGKSQVRIVPYAFNKENPFIELFFHYEIGKRTMISPSSFGRPDPILEFANKLKKTGDKDDWKLGKKIEPKFRVFVPVLVRGQENEGVKFWSFGKQIYTELLNVIADPDYGDISDLMNGRDLTIEHTAPEKEGAYPTFMVRVKPNTSPATTDQEVSKAILEGQREISTLFTENTYDEMKDALTKWLQPESEDTGIKNPGPIQNALTTSAAEVEGAFAHLFKKP